MNKNELGAALRALRLASGKEAKAVARSAVMSPSKLSKIENGALSASPADVDRILSALGVSDEVRAEYMSAARAASTEATAWRLLRRTGIYKAQHRTRALEAAMRELKLFQPALVPGLLQTPEYIRAVLARHDLPEESMARTMAARIDRQSVLYEAGRTLRFVITEPVLRWRIVSVGMMAAQLDRIISMSRLPNVDIRVVPLSSVQSDIANHAFVIRDDNTVTVETVHAELVVSDPRDVSLYVRKFDGFAEMAVAGDTMRSMIEGIRDEFLREQESD
ncbi:helix-turn-helix transcriptional regulator [Kitasatospora sp. NPDC085895]|uniref:helix-turn-helix domain-containing protein n=1 Tax=Kitasatospora sp. NPDC085895 TaxID=3155057 RepID=UPI00344FE77B